MEIPALLKMGGCEVDVFCAANSWAVQNSFYDNWINAPENEDEFVEQLITLVTRGGLQYDWVIPGEDVVLELLNARITDEQLFYKMLPLTKIENRQLLGSKAGFSNLCAKYGIKTPAYLVYEEGMSASEIGKKVGFPSLMKVNSSAGGYGIFKCENEQDITAHLAKIENKDNLVIQQIIKGYDINTEVLYKDGELIVYNYSKTTVIMKEFGVSTQRLFYHNTEVEQELIKAGRSLGLNGFGNVVFMYDEVKKEHFLIEIDVRPNTWVYYGKFTGNDFSEAVRKIINKDLTLIKQPDEFKNKAITLSLYKKDVYRCIMNKDLGGLMKWVFNVNNNWRYIPNYDRKLKKATNKYLYDSFMELFTHRIKKVTGTVRGD